MENKKLNPIAIELNKTIEQENNTVFGMLSDFGRRMFFPKGILEQSKKVSVKNPRLKATLGMAVNDGDLLTYDYAAELSGQCNKENSDEFLLTRKDIYSYEQVSGRKELIDLWTKKILNDNFDLNKDDISTPLPVTGITHGLFVFSDLFICEDDQIVVPELIWGNYNLIFKERRGAEFVKYPFFDKDKFNIDGFESAISQAIDNAVNKQKSKIIILLNFPNNPTGYSPTPAMIKKIKEIVLSKADDINIIAVCDDAYFGLFFDEDDVVEKRQSPFSAFASLHKNILAVKVDGATKEELSWGLRVGFITLGTKGGSDVLYNALNEKIKGAIRSSVSSGSKIGQSLLYKILTHKDHKKEKQEKIALLKGRALKVKKILVNKKFDEVWTPYPFNSGYFMTLKLKGIKARDLWSELLENHDIGVIYLDETHLRIAFSSVDLRDLDELFETIYKTAKQMKIDS